tara:strand:+ start:394 stop:588 length:195 start_codon:yes stop_codon:yes gene_type:complete
MDHDTLVKTLQSEGNLKYSFSGNEIEALCHWMTIETFKQADNLISKRNTCRQPCVHLERTGSIS